MNLTLAPRGILQIDDARICFRNFKGEGGRFNREGDRNFALIIPDEQMANDLLADRWNVKIKPPREEGDDPFMYLSVKVKFNDHGPVIYLRNGKVRQRITEDMAHILDNVTIDHVDLDIRPYDYDVDERIGGTGRTAYLQSMEVFQIVDRFDQRYEEEYGDVQ